MPPKPIIGDPHPAPPPAPDRQETVCVLREREDRGLQAGRSFLALARPPLDDDQELVEMGRRESLRAGWIDQHRLAVRALLTRFVSRMDESYPVTSARLIVRVIDHELVDHEAEPIRAREEVQRRGADRQRDRGRRGPSPSSATGANSTSLDDGRCHRTYGIPSAHPAKCAPTPSRSGLVRSVTAVPDQRGAGRGCDK